MNPLSLADSWNTVAQGYSEDVVPLFERFALDALQLAELGAPDRIIDIAAGPGTLALLAAQHVAHVTAADFSEEMLRVLSRRIHHTSADNVFAVHADCQQLPFDNASFDAAFSMFGLMFFPDRAKGLREAARVLKPGGRVVISSWAPTAQVPLLASMSAAISDYLSAPASGEASLPLTNPNDLRSELEAAGFVDVTVAAVAHGVEVPSASQFWAVQERSAAPMVALKNSLPPAGWEELGRAVQTRIQQDYGTGPYELTFTAHLGLGTRPNRATKRHTG